MTLSFSRYTGLTPGVKIGIILMFPPELIDPIFVISFESEKGDFHG
jgi:hypothetical protein